MYTSSILQLVHLLPIGGICMICMEMLPKYVVIGTANIKLIYK